ncbi:putative signal peptide protein [Puccinia sorghi]|uniref:Putative signal peptide protein n=1 Tax=Puccinia sorghi TaxID=27349 RepID=A0A0L6UQE2_9BASI|nr:putative signal peptide protein [Puccinia sorghi]
MLVIFWDQILMCICPAWDFNSTGYNTFYHRGIFQLHHFFQSFTPSCQLLGKLSIVMEIFFNLYHHTQTTFFFQLSNCSNIMNCTFRAVGSQAAKLNQVIKTWAKVHLLMLNFVWWMTFFTDQYFHQPSQCDHNFTKEYQGHQMTTHKSWSMNHIIFLIILPSFFIYNISFNRYFLDPGINTDNHPRSYGEFIQEIDVKQLHASSMETTLVFGDVRKWSYRFLLRCGVFLVSGPCESSPCLSMEEFQGCLHRGLTFGGRDLWSLQAKPLAGKKIWPTNKGVQSSKGIGMKGIVKSDSVYSRDEMEKLTQGEFFWKSCSFIEKTKCIVGDKFVERMITEEIFSNPWRLHFILCFCPKGSIAALASTGNLVLAVATRPSSKRGLGGVALWNYS